MLADRAVFVVADGMGGHAAGEVASGIATATLGELAERPHRRRDDLVGALALANRRILESVARHPEQTGMGTTAAGLAVVNAGGSDHWAVFNVGDSRVYRFVDGRLRLVTVDHSEVRELSTRGSSPRTRRARHPLRNVVTRSLGSEPAADAGRLGVPAARRASGSSSAPTGCPTSCTDDRIGRARRPARRPAGVRRRARGGRGRVRRPRQRLGRRRRARRRRRRRLDDVDTAPRGQGPGRADGGSPRRAPRPARLDHRVRRAVSTSSCAVAARSPTGSARRPAGGGLDDVLDALSRDGVRATPDFVAVRGRCSRCAWWHARQRVCRGVTGPRGEVELRAPARGPWSDEDAPPGTTAVSLRTGEEAAAVAASPPQDAVAQHTQQPPEHTPCRRPSRRRTRRPRPPEGRRRRP